MSRHQIGSYVSPIPAGDAPNYRKRVEGAPIVERLHMWLTPDGGRKPCDPRCCRECERERTWTMGQTHGGDPHPLGIPDTPNVR